MERYTEATPEEITWRYDTESSWVLRLIAHGFIAGLGGILLFTSAMVLLTLPKTLPELELGTILLIVLLLLVGGPFSLVYLWPMITDPDQRPNANAFIREGGSIPWTRRSAAIAALTGAVVLGGLILTDVSFNLILTLLVFSVFSPAIVSLFTTVGTIEDGHMKCNGNEVDLRRLAGVRSVQIGSVVVYWLTYTAGTGLLVPRLITIPVGMEEEIAARLEQGIECDPER